MNPDVLLGKLRTLGCPVPFAVLVNAFRPNHTPAEVRFALAELLHQGRVVTARGRLPAPTTYAAAPGA